MTPLNNYSPALVSMGNLFQDPHGYQNLQMLKSTCTDTHICIHTYTCRSMHIVDPAHLQAPNRGLQIPFSIHGWLSWWNPQVYGGTAVYLLKKSMCKWVCAVQTCLVQGSSVVSFHLNKIKSYALWAEIIFILEMKTYELRKFNFPKIISMKACN